MRKAGTTNQTYSLGATFTVTSGQTIENTNFFRDKIYGNHIEAPAINNTYPFVV